LAEQKEDAPEMRHAFAKALRRARKARGLTQEDFELVSSRTYLSSLERGKQSPTLDKVQDLARTIGIHPLSLLTLTCLYADHHYDIDSLIARVKHELEPTEQETPMIRVLITDDHAIMRAGLKRLFALVDDIGVVGEAASGEEAIARLADGDTDLLLLDLSMPGLCGKDLIAVIRNLHPGLPILVLSMHIEAGHAQNALDAGASGYVTKDQSPEILLAAVRRVACGERFIDPKLADQVSFAGAP
jgi:CheY-like chemotaxis protein/DNA-binding XRE family transcriptional regulator